MFKEDNSSFIQEQSASLISQTVFICKYINQIQNHKIFVLFLHYKYKKLDGDMPRLYKMMFI